jgi:hypothetical protein
MTLSLPTFRLITESSQACSQFDTIAVLEEIDDSPLLFDLKSFGCISSQNFRHDRLDVPPTGHWPSRLLSAWFPNRSNKLLNRPDKDALRAMLESQVQEKLQHDPDAVTTYAAQPEPERKPYTSKPTVQDKAFNRELDQMRADAEAGVIHKSVREPMNDGESNLALDDYPGLKEAGSASNQW